MANRGSGRGRGFTVGERLGEDIDQLADVGEEGVNEMGELFSELFMHHRDQRTRSIIKIFMLSFMIASLIYVIIALHHVDERQQWIKQHLQKSLDLSANLTMQNAEILANLLVVPCDTDTDALLTVGCLASP